MYNVIKLLFLCWTPQHTHICFINGVGLFLDSLDPQWPSELASLKFGEGLSIVTVLRRDYVNNTEWNSHSVALWLAYMVNKPPKAALPHWDRWCERCTVHSVSWDAQGRRGSQSCSPSHWTQLCQKIVKLGCCCIFFLVPKFGWVRLNKSVWCATVLLLILNGLLILFILVTLFIITTSYPVFVWLFRSLKPPIA